MQISRQFVKQFLRSSVLKQTIVRKNPQTLVHVNQKCFFSSKNEEPVKEEKVPESNEKSLQSLKEIEEQSEKLREQLAEAEKNLKHKAKDLQDAQKNISTLESQNREQIKKMKELRDALASQLEDSESQMARHLKEKEQLKIFAISSFAKDLLDVKDSIEKALESVQPSEQDSQLYKGIKMTESCLNSIFSRNGITREFPLNEKFNPDYHEAMFEINDPSQEVGTVGHVAQPGYLIQGRVLRAARVGVIKKRAE